MRQELDLSAIPRLPQAALLCQVATDLWQNPEIAAIWLGGSLARGAGDRHSDVDLRIAIASARYEVGPLPKGTQRVAKMIVAKHDVEFGADASLHQLLLSNGQIYDLFVQTTVRTPSEERRLIIGCRDPEFGAKLLNGQDPAPKAPKAAGSEQIRQILSDYWIGLRKHSKVLHRNLDLVAWHGEHHLRGYLFRLYHISASGSDCGSIDAMTIHSMSPAATEIQKEFGNAVLAELGRPTRTREEFVESVASIANEVARVGRLLAHRAGFEYPATAEKVARAVWLSNGP
jgi:predicted nucleotidyltransferase